jgi:hypothetical protein
VVAIRSKPETRCYFLYVKHIGAVEALTRVASDEAAIEQAEALFKKRRNELLGFEVCDHARLVYRYPSPLPKVTVSPDSSTTTGTRPGTA